ncbi:MAG: hypothetical protein JKY51_08955, partial [Opitutaceae bacterium]|nr:hypothetical protein [Opitutaceae bacterium]
MKKAPEQLAGEIDAFIANIDLEKGLAKNTFLSYQGDLEDCASFLS